MPLLQEKSDKVIHNYFIYKSLAFTIYKSFYLLYIQFRHLQTIQFFFINR